MRWSGMGQSQVRVVLYAAVITGVFSTAHAAASLGTGPGGSPAPAWTVHLQQVDEALARKDVSAAGRAWHTAYLTALRSRRWEGMLEVGDAYLRIGEVSGFREASEPKARRLYLSALFRARNAGDLVGVLRAAEAFAQLGDREVVENCLVIADRLAARAADPLARERVREFASRLATRFSAATNRTIDPF